MYRQNHNQEDHHRLQHDPPDVRSPTPSLLCGLQGLRGLRAAMGADGPGARPAYDARIKNGMASVHPLRALRRLQRKHEPGRYTFMNERGRSADTASRGPPHFPLADQ